MMAETLLYTTQKSMTVSNISRRLTLINTNMQHCQPWFQGKTIKGCDECGSDPHWLFSFMYFNPVVCCLSSACTTLGFYWWTLEQHWFRNIYPSPILSVNMLAYKLAGELTELKHILVMHLHDARHCCVLYSHNPLLPTKMVDHRGEWADTLKPLGHKQKNGESAVTQTVKPTKTLIMCDQLPVVWQ